MDINRTKSIDIVLNGETREVPAGLTVMALLQHVGVVPDRVAVELDRQIVRKPEWESTSVRSGAQVEIVQFVGGG